MTRPGSALLLALLLLPVPAARAEVPVRTEQLIYSVLAYNGKDYSPTFVLETSGTVYLVERAESFLSLRKTLVYFWPVDGQWLTDTDTLNKPFDGTLELRDARGALRTLPQQRFTYYNARGEYEQNWKVAKGAEADAEYARYAALMDAYNTAVIDHQRRNQEYDDRMNGLSDRADALRAAGKDPSAVLDEIRAAVRPQEPPVPIAYVVPPVAVQQAFLLDLPSGEYTALFRNPDGTVMEGSEKRIVVHGPGARGGSGFEVIPGDRWTRPEETKVPGSVLYVSGGTDIFLVPFSELEFNELAYRRTVSNQARGNAAMRTWVRVQQVPRARIEVRRGGLREVLEEGQFVIQQASGGALGYTIVPYDPRSFPPGTEPGLAAFRVALSTRPETLRVSASGADGVRLPGSGRQIRVVPPAGALLPLVAACLVPLILMAVVLALRARRTR